VDFRDIVVDTGRLRLRRYQDSDFEAMAGMHARPDVARFLPWEVRDRRASREAFERHLDTRLDVEGDGVTLAAIEKGSGAFVGESVLFLRSVQHRTGEVGYIVHPDFTGRGYATEGARAMLRIGFEQVKLHRVVGRLDARNEPSARVLAKLGMRKEAHFVRNEELKGEWTDEVVYALLAEEWMRGESHAQ
jgi:RimJ/RimL family protein N-acetyltransferase